MAVDGHFGDWVKATKILANAADRHRKAVDKAMLMEAHYLRTHIIKGIASSAPGGKPYKPLAPMTLELRKLGGFGGTKPLIRTGTFRGSVAVHKDGDNYFVGILRSARSADGKSLVNIGMIHEAGATVVITPKMRAAFFGLLKKHGLVQQGPRLPNGRFFSGAARNSFQIPARPTFGPVFDMYARPNDVRKRFIKNLAEMLNYDFGKG